TQPLSIAFSNTANTVPPPSETLLTSEAANVIASSTTQPISADQNTEPQTPRAAALAAPCVSSEMCADASKPVIVYWVRRKPSGSTYHQNMLSPKPELFRCVVKTWSTLACWSGTMTRTPTITATPRTCHHTEMLLKIATRWLPRMLMKMCRHRIR